MLNHLAEMEAKQTDVQTLSLPANFSGGSGLGRHPYCTSEDKAIRQATALRLRSCATAQGHRSKAQANFQHHAAYRPWHNSTAHNECIKATLHLSELSTIAMTRRLIVYEFICRDQPTAMDLETTSTAIKEGRS